MSIRDLDIGYCPRCGTTHYLGEYCPTQPPSVMARCTRHNSYFFGPSCFQCDEDARRAGRDVITMLESRIADLETAQLRSARAHDTMHRILQDLQRLANDRADTELAACLAGV